MSAMGMASQRRDVLHEPRRSSCDGRPTAPGGRCRCRCARSHHRYLTRMTCCHVLTGCSIHSPHPPHKAYFTRGVPAVSGGRGRAGHGCRRRRDSSSSSATRGVFVVARPTRRTSAVRRHLMVRTLLYRCRICYCCCCYGRVCAPARTDSSAHPPSLDLTGRATV